MKKALFILLTSFGIHHFALATEIPQQVNLFLVEPIRIAWDFSSSERSYYKSEIASYRVSVKSYESNRCTVEYFTDISDVDEFAMNQPIYQANVEVNKFIQSRTDLSQNFYTVNLKIHSRLIVTCFLHQQMEPQLEDLNQLLKGKIVVR